jgi:hypothetical protein
MQATRGEPCNTAMFIVEPSARIFGEYEAAVKAQREHAKRTLPKKKRNLALQDHFDTRLGWGYDFIKNKDKWQAINHVGNRWRFYASHSDQGLMYYVAKFLYKDVSIAIGHKVENWKGVEGSVKPEKESELMDVLEKHQPKLLAYMYSCNNPMNLGDFKWTCNPPYNSFAHFSGGRKPWQNQFNIAEKLTSSMFTGYQNATLVVWWQELIALNEKLEMNLDLEHWNEKYLPGMKESPLGYIAKYWDPGTTTPLNNSTSSA